jgi:hypothetical protein
LPPDGNQTGDRSGPSATPTGARQNPSYQGQAFAPRRDVIREFGEVALEKTQAGDSSEPWPSGRLGRELCS